MRIDRGDAHVASSIAALLEAGHLGLALDGHAGFAQCFDQ
jgi:hypothetical protein